MINIDRQTIPFCLIKEKTMEWGEVYNEYNPMFITILTEKNLSLKESIIFFGENNFKNQLSNIHNILLNFEEKERICNFDNEIFDRTEMLNLIIFYIEKNKNIVSPWEKYDIGLCEEDYIEIVEYSFNQKLQRSL